MKINYNDIFSFLSKTNNITLIKIILNGYNENCYITNYNKECIWAITSLYKKIKLFPNKDIKIIKIGYMEVESEEEFKLFIKDHQMYENFKKQEIIKQAYIHSKKTV